MKKRKRRGEGREVGKEWGSEGIKEGNRVIEMRDGRKRRREEENEGK